MIVSLASVAPGVVGHFSADTGIDAQQADGTDRKRESNLYAPVDDDHDVGMRGRFADEANGVMTPAFVRSLPGTAATLVSSVGSSLADRVRQVRTNLRSEEHTSDPQSLMLLSYAV